ncbi:nicotinamide-nucleotide amidase [Anaerosporobacter mobilis DSM 15930]|jgi:nicotinamide-nucleotide amidase|uniref:Putative competence-damage inducible protein n=1 Tax=Anaerosporobacter mobilis DSM 15930 TaxID=1120996 RepID=A0A1M7ER28_9FIRM|nr:competence/damage-inducible protein A [Anaerosporobacter mobilis]SHL94043.1 nicotinamide-nucleotide amidase [Anaerosporobacter mobilis DSM 15930]
MVVELISVGTELLLGNIVNTNAAYLSEKCAELGMSLYYEVTVGDNEERLLDTVTTAINRSDVIILTGGLGPTQDDLTKETVAKALNLPIVEDRHTRERIENHFKRSNYKVVTENNWKQAKIIEGCKVVDNQNGTAPGLIVETQEGKRVILLPGPPNEMIPMFENDIYEYLNQINPNVIYSKMVKICGIGESMVETEITDLIEAQSNPTIAPYAKSGEVHLRVTASAPTVEEAKKLVKPIVKELKDRFKENVYTTDEAEALEDTVVKLLKKYDLSLATAESCTGGLFTGRIVNVAGASDVLKEGFITYSNKAKKKNLDVSKNTLKKHGAVSEQCAKEMAKGAAINTGSDVAVAITGIAGPDGGTDEKPVGLVYIACFANEKVTVKEFNFKGNRQKIREGAVIYALDLLRRCILNNYK